MPNQPSLLFMAPLLSLLFFFLIISSSKAQGGPPSPGYNPSSKFNPISFNQGFRNLWGPKHQSLDQGSVTIWLDRNSGLSSSPYLPFSKFYSLLVLKIELTPIVC